MPVKKSLSNVRFLSLFTLTALLFVSCSTKHQHTRSGSSYNYNKSSSSKSSYPSTSSQGITRSSNSGSQGKIRSSKAIHRATMRPYNVHGKKYYPSVVELGQEFEGISSWYGPNFHGKKTSNGEVYDMHGLTAAHKTLPMNTIVKVYNKNNGKEVTVRINDRGPFIVGRIIDLSFTAGKKVGLDKTGIAPVILTVLEFDRHVKGGGSTSSVKPKANKAKFRAIGSYAVQIGSFRREAGAQKVQKGAGVIYPNYKIKVRESQLGDAPIYRVWVTGFRSEDEARDFVSENGIESTYIIAE